MDRNILVESSNNFVLLHATIGNSYEWIFPQHRCHFPEEKKNKQKNQKPNNPNQTNQPTKYLQQKTQFCVVKSMAGVSLDGPWTANLHAITPDGSLTLQSNGWRLGDILESCKGLDYEISLNIFPFQLLPVSFAHSSLKTEETSISLPQIPYKCFKKFLLFAQCKDHNAP